MWSSQINQSKKNIKALPKMEMKKTSKRVVFNRQSKETPTVQAKKRWACEPKLKAIIIDPLNNSLMKSMISQDIIFAPRRQS